MRNGFHRLTALPLLLAPILAALLLIQPAPVGAQDVPDELLEQAARRSGMSREELLQRYRDQAGAAGAAAADQTAEPGRTALPEAAARTVPDVILPFADQLAAAKEAAADTTAEVNGLPPEFFGADFFQGDPDLFGAPAFGPVPADYLLGPGDEITVDVWGEVEFRHERIVERDGSVILPRGGRVDCAGRTLAAVTRAIRQNLSRSYSGIDPEGDGGTTYVEVGLGRLRAIRVYVVGEAARPGAYELTSLATVFTALHAAGGPGPMGSLRDVRLVRGRETVSALDLYDYLLSGVREGDAVLRDGDTVFVPPRELTVSIEGAVRRPLTYELRGGEGVHDLIRFAGGFTAEAETRLVHVERIVPPAERGPDSPDRVQRDLDLRLKMIHLMQDGDAVTVDAVSDRLDNYVEIRGNVKRPGRYEHAPGAGVRDLIRRAGGLWDDTLMERAVLDRTDPDGTFRSLDVPLGAVVRGEADDPRLQSRDVLRVFSIWDLRDRYQVHVDGEVREPGAVDWRQGLTLRDAVLKVGGLTDAADVLRAEISRLDTDAVTGRDLGAPPERTVKVIRVELGADWLTAAASFQLEPHDRVAVRRLPWWQLQRTVTVRGEVAYPGTYVLDSPDERISGLIARAGGLKDTAYAPGARIVRAQDGIGNVALDLGKALARPGHDHDAILESGDEILVPPIPYVVKVTGAVGFPTSIIWEDGKSLGDYVSRAGGYAEGSDKWKTHVVYPNGMSKQIRRIWNDPEVRPGSTVVVPYETPDEGPGDLATLKEIASIIASVATVWLVIDRTQ